MFNLDQYELNAREMIDAAQKSGDQKLELDGREKLNNLTQIKNDIQNSSYNNPSTMDKILVGTGKGLMDFGQGAKQLAMAAGEKLGVTDPAAYKAYTDKVDNENNFYGKTPIGDSAVGEVSRFVGNSLPYAALPFGEIAKGVGSAGKALGAAGGVVGKVGDAIASNVGKNAITGAALGAPAGAAQFVPEGGSRLNNTIGGALIGGALPFAAPAVGGVISALGKNVASPLATAAKQVSAHLTGYPKSTIADNLYGDITNFDQTAANLQKAQAQGYTITPGEASGNPLTMSREAALGQSRHGAQQILAAGQKREGDINASIDNLLNSLAPSNSSGAAKAQGAAQQMMSASKNARQAAAQPYYDKAYQQSISNDQFNTLMKDPIIRNTMISVSKNPYYAKDFQSINEDAMSALASKTGTELRSGTVSASGDDLNINAPQRINAIKNDYQSKINNLVSQGDNEGAAQLSSEMRDVLTAWGDKRFRSIQFLDLVKKDLDPQYMNAASKTVDGGNNALKAGNILDSKNLLLKIADSVSPAYKKARFIFGDQSGDVNYFKNSAISKIAMLQGDDLKNVSHMIFDKTQTDPNVLAKIQLKFMQQSPDVWKQLLRNHLENGLDQVRYIGKPGNDFYNKFLATDRDFNQLLIATKGMPQVQENLINFRATLKNLNDPITPKTAAGMTKNNMNQARNTKQAILDSFHTIVGGKYDKAAINMMLDPNSQQLLRSLVKMKNQKSQATVLKSILDNVNNTEIGRRAQFGIGQVLNGNTQQQQ